MNGTLDFHPSLRGFFDPCLHGAQSLIFYDEYLVPQA